MILLSALFLCETDRTSSNQAEWENYTQRADVAALFSLAVSFYSCCEYLNLSIRRALSLLLRKRSFSEEKLYMQMKKLVQAEVLLL